jgi:3' terminal RNA ribose 2'-O-methyltransferase Hen1
MLLTLTTTHHPATDLGFLLHKNPERVHDMELSFGRAVMFYPEATDQQTTFTLALDIDPVALVRGRRPGGDGLLDQYVNDRPYAASSFLSVAIAKTLRNALGGSSKERADLAATPIPLQATVLPLPVRRSEGLIERLFAPLGYTIKVEPIPLDEAWPEWGPSPYVKLTLTATCRLSALLSHLYVLIPVLDHAKHYYVDHGELQKLLDKGAGWLAGHPERELIATRYLRHKRALAAEVLALLAAEDDVATEEEEAATQPEIETATAAPATEPAVADKPKDAAEEALEKPIRLHELRLDRVAEALKAARARRVIDLGCGSGKLLKRLAPERQFSEIIGVDVSAVSLAQASRRLRLDRLPEREKAGIKLLQGALTYRDRRLEGYDAAAIVEVIEHLEPDRLPAFERAVFEFARPSTVVITTPNVEYNVKFEGMTPGSMRHADHRFEWTRQEFEDWAGAVAARYGYQVTFDGIGEEDPDLGTPSQLAVFERNDGAPRPPR